MCRAPKALPGPQQPLSKRKRVCEQLNVVEVIPAAARRMEETCGKWGCTGHTQGAGVSGKMIIDRRGRKQEC